MAELILHHFDASPFAEKARLALGLKRAAWRSVQIPMLMPRPALMPLTGGYRKTPVLQIGADVYCDSRLIARELEQCIAIVAHQRTIKRVDELLTLLGRRRAPVLTEHQTRCMVDIEMWQQDAIDQFTKLRRIFA